MGGKIDCYVDIVSWFSYVALVELLANREKLASHGVDIEFHPVFLGGIMRATGNKPPWMLPARSEYTPYDGLRVATRAGLPDIRFPANFMAMSNSTPALRALHSIRASHPVETFLTVLRFLFHSFFTPPQHADVSKAEVVADVLRCCPKRFDGSGSGEGRLFTDAQVGAIMEAAGGSEMKESVRKETEEALAKGAFGAPWMIVRDGQGREDTFFGSDRFIYVYEHLGLPVRGVEILGAGAAGTKL